MPVALLLSALGLARRPAVGGFATASYAACVWVRAEASVVKADATGPRAVASEWTVESGQAAATVPVPSAAVKPGWTAATAGFGGTA